MAKLTLNLFDIEYLDLIPDNFYNIGKYVRKYTNTPIPLYHGTDNVGFSLIHVEILQAIKIRSDKDTKAVFVLQDYSKVMDLCDDYVVLLEAVAPQDKTIFHTRLLQYLSSVITVLIALTDVILKTLFNNKMLLEVKLLQTD